MKSTPVRGVKENLKPWTYKRSEPCLQGDGVPFVQCACELLCEARLRDLSLEAAGKPSLNRANEFRAVDPKPSDLSMARLKLG